MEALTPLERAVLDKLLAGDDPTLAILRAQAESAQLRSRKNTGVGFYCYFDVPDDIERIGRATFRLGDVNATMKGLSHGAGFVLFVKDGRLDNLEGYTYDEPWPTTISDFELAYQNHPRKLALPVSTAQ